MSESSIPELPGGREPREISEKSVEKLENHLKNLDEKGYLVKNASSLRVSSRGEEPELSDRYPLDPKVFAIISFRVVVNLEDQSSSFVDVEMELAKRLAEIFKAGNFDVSINIGEITRIVEVEVRTGEEGRPLGFFISALEDSPRSTSGESQESGKGKQFTVSVSFCGYGGRSKAELGTGVMECLYRWALEGFPRLSEKESEGVKREPSQIMQRRYIFLGGAERVGRSEAPPKTEDLIRMITDKVDGFKEGENYDRSSVLFTAGSYKIIRYSANVASKVGEGDKGEIVKVGYPKYVEDEDEEKGERFHALSISLPEGVKTGGLSHLLGEESEGARKVACEIADRLFLILESHGFPATYFSMRGTEKGTKEGTEEGTESDVFLALGRSPEQVPILMISVKASPGEELVGGLEVKTRIISIVIAISSRDGGEAEEVRRFFQEFLIPWAQKGFPKISTQQEGGRPDEIRISLN